MLRSLPTENPLVVRYASRYWRQQNCRKNRDAHATSSLLRDTFVAAPAFLIVQQTCTMKTYLSAAKLPSRAAILRLVPRLGPFSTTL